jgi:hypothetical protein
MVPAQSRTQILQCVTDARRRDNRRNKLIKASHYSTLTAYWPTLIPPSLPLRPTIRPSLPPQPNNLHNYGWKPDPNFRIRIHTPPPAEYPFHHSSPASPGRERKSQTHLSASPLIGPDIPDSPSLADTDTDRCDIPPREHFTPSTPTPEEGEYLHILTSPPPTTEITILTLNTENGNQ